MLQERRLSPRVAILGQIHGHAVLLDVPVVVREVSLSGLSVETGFPLPVGAVHQFELTLGDGAKVRLHGVIRRSLSVGSDSADPTYVSGIEFVDDPPDAPSSGAGAVLNLIS